MMTYRGYYHVSFISAIRRPMESVVYNKLNLKDFIFILFDLDKVTFCHYDRIDFAHCFLLTLLSIKPCYL